MRISVNEESVEAGWKTVGEARDSIKPGSDLFVLNGFPVGPDAPLKEGDVLVLIRKGEIPSISELEALMMARHTPGVHRKLKGSVVGIAGVGGLGSHVAVALARSGIGRLVIADQDIVEPSNLNRQAYDLDDIGTPKVEAMERLLLSLNPFVAIDAVQTHLTKDNVLSIFKDCEVVVEALDRPDSKVEIIEALLSGNESIKVVGASGVAGYGPGNDIRTERIGKLHICGDRTTEAKEGVGLMAPRVMLVAGHQANQVLRILLDEDRE